MFTPFVFMFFVFCILLPKMLPLSLSHTHTHICCIIHIQNPKVLDLAINLQKSTCTGDTIQIPYELTITESIHDFWQSAFHSQDRIHTSTPYARYIGLQDRVLPFSLVLFLTSSMTHADAAKVQVGFGKAVYHWPAFAGDTFKKTFQVQSIRNTSDGNHSVR
mmetsp:Transcript_63685/g.94553  ORF Transcript_63685/g.94553 Transcript_63685/m.94553 type:complete len:162 (+) Transcript_63685:628-1113(+)